MIKSNLKLKEDKKPRSDKKIRVNSSLDFDTHEKLKKLAVSCDMTKTMLSAEIIKIVVNHVEFIEWFQGKYNKNEQYKVFPIRKDGKTYY